MNAVADAGQDLGQDVGRAGRPFGVLGLCLSLIGLAVLALIGTALICAAVVAVVATAMGWQHFGDVARQAFAHGNETFETRCLLAAVLAFYVAVAAAILVAAKWRGGAKWRDLIGWLPFRLSDWRVWAIMAAALAYSAGTGIALAHVAPHSPLQLMIPSDPAAASMLFIVAAVVAPVTEELLFRGWIYTALRFSWGFWPALLISSTLFALAHYDRTHFYALAVFPIGLAIGLIRERAGIKASIVFHAINNFAAFALAALGAG
jgi:membrane protease YdiL (CAAX protease family)